MFLEDMNVKPKVSAALESALFILLFDAMIRHIIHTTNKAGITCAITLSTISFYRNNATKTRTQFLKTRLNLLNDKLVKSKSQRNLHQTPTF